MKNYLSILLVLYSINLFSQETIYVDAYNRGIFCTGLKSANSTKSPIKIISTHVDNWLFLKLKEERFISSIEIDFFDRSYRSVSYEVRMNNRIDTLTVDSIIWSIEINDTISSFSLNSINGDGSPTIEEIKFIIGEDSLALNIKHKSKIDDPKVLIFHNTLESRLLLSISNQIDEIRNLYNKEIKNLLDIKQKRKIERLFTNYSPDPKCDFFNLVHSFAKDSENVAQSLLIDNTTNKRKREKYILKSKKQYIHAANLYAKAQLIDCSSNVELTFKIVSCLNHAEKFKKAEKLLLPFIENSDLDAHFFSYYFMTKNKVSRPKELRENGFLYYSCGGSPDIIDSEYYYTNIIMNNAILLYLEKDYRLLLEYFKHSSIRINWSDDYRLNQLNKVICQMLIKSLVKVYSESVLISEFNSSEIFTREHDLYGIGVYMNYPQKTLELFDLPLKIYSDNPSLFSELIDEKPIIDFEEEEDEMKRKTIIHELMAEMLSFPSK